MPCTSRLLQSIKHSVCKETIVRDFVRRETIDLPPEEGIGLQNQRYHATDNWTRIARATSCFRLRRDLERFGDSRSSEIAARDRDVPTKQV